MKESEKSKRQSIRVGGGYMVHRLPHTQTQTDKLDAFLPAMGCCCCFFVWMCVFLVHALKGASVFVHTHRDTQYKGEQCSAA